MQVDLLGCETMFRTVDLRKSTQIAAKVCKILCQLESFGLSRTYKDEEKKR